MDEDIFISYSWDNEMHKRNVLSFVNFLRKKGFKTSIDVSEMQKETTIQFKEMMLNNLKNAKKVIVVLSDGYKKKADSFSSGVGSEYRYIIEDIERNKTKYILVSFKSLEGDILEQITPSAFIGREVVDIFSDKENNYEKLFSKLMDENLFELSEVADTKPKLIKKDVPEFEEFQETVEKEKVEKYDIDKFDHPNTFFDYRLAKSFPGIRDGKWFINPAEAIERLKLLLQEPLKINNRNMSDPIWFFRGSSNIYIHNFQIINDEKCIIGIEECLIDKIYVYRSPSYFRSFVYVQLKPEKTTGIYNNVEKSIEQQLNYHGYASEEYALYKEHPVTRAEYDDGAAFIDGKLVEFNGKANLRMRHLTKYNFIICAKYNPINCTKGDVLTKECLNNILKNENEIEKLVEIVEKLPKIEL